jgi:hypothetical protein
VILSCLFSRLSWTYQILKAFYIFRKDCMKSSKASSADTSSVGRHPHTMNFCLTSQWKFGVVVLFVGEGGVAPPGRGQTTSAARTKAHAATGSRRPQRTAGPSARITGPLWPHWRSGSRRDPHRVPGRRPSPLTDAAVPVIWRTAAAV